MTFIPTSNKTQNIIFAQLELQISYIVSLTYQNIISTQMIILTNFNIKNTKFSLILNTCCTIFVNNQHLLHHFCKQPTPSTINSY